MTKTYPVNIETIISPYFRASEFKCRCTQCLFILIDDNLLALLNKMRDSLGKPIHINSGYRCPSYQVEMKLKGYETAPVPPSQHELGCAADIMCGDMPGGELEKVARAAGFKAVGVGHNWVHVDTRSDKDRRWEYLKR